MTISNKPIPRILITNDDGSRAEGLRVLEQIAAELSDDVWVVAPEFDQSGVSHSLTLHTPLRIYSISDRYHCVNGTPADCVLLGVEHLMRDQKPSLILSGVNRGANVSDAVAYSGTVGAAMTGVLLGIPSIALSQYYRQAENIRWDTAAQLAPSVILQAYRCGWSSEVCLNINFPDIPADEVQGVTLSRPRPGSIAGVEIDKRPDRRDEPYYWIGFRYAPKEEAEPGSDVEALRRGYISVSPLRFESALQNDSSELSDALSDCLR